MYLLFDIGGTNLRIGVSANGEAIDSHKKIPTPQDFDEGIKTIKQLADELSQGQKIEALTGGVAGPLDKEKTMLIKSPHIGGWVQKPLKQRLAEVFDAKVYLENDTALVALGEANYGAGKGKNIVAYLGIGTGVGGARIVNAKIDQNSLGFEPGHQIIVPDGNLCHCGGKGHLETYVAGAYQEGSKTNWDEVAKYLAIGLNNTIVHWSPDIVVLGGGVMQSIPLDKIKAYLQKELTIFPQPPEIVAAKLGNEAGFYGGLTILKTKA